MNRHDATQSRIAKLHRATLRELAELLHEKMQRNAADAAHSYTERAERLLRAADRAMALNHPDAAQSLTEDAKAHMQAAGDILANGVASIDEIESDIGATFLWRYSVDHLHAAKPLFAVLYFEAMRLLGVAQALAVRVFAAARNPLPKIQSPANEAGALIHTFAASA